MNKNQKPTAQSSRSARPPRSRSQSSQAGADRRKRARLRREAVRIAEYLVSGGLYFWVGYGVFFVADSLLGWKLFWAKLTANVIGWTVNYVLLRFWVFSNPRLNKGHPEVSSRYIAVTLFNFGLDFLIVYGLQRLGITPYLGQFVSAGFFTVWNYLVYRFWVFTSRLHHHAPRRAIVSRANKTVDHTHKTASKRRR